MNTIIGELGRSKKFIEIVNHLEKQKSPVVISGLVSVGIVQQLVALHEFSKKPICIITYNEIEAKRIYENIKYFTDKVVLFPKKEIVTYDYVAESKDLPYQRIECLNEIVTKKSLIVVTTIEAVMQTIPEKNILYKNTLSFKVGDICNIDNIKEKLVSLGYVRYNLIEGRGQFSIRGDIIDISVTENTGIRIELWGDEIDSIRNFNIVTQRSIKNLDKVKINPAHEFILDKDIEEVCNEISKLPYKNKDILEEDIEQIKSGNYISKIDKYFECFYGEKKDNQVSNLISYLNSNYIVAIDELTKIQQRANTIQKDLKNLFKTLIEKEKIIPQALQNIIDIEDIEKQVKQKKIYLEKQDKKSLVQAENFHFNYREINYYKSDVESFIKDMHRYIAERKRVYLLVNTKEKVKNIQKILNEEDIPNVYESNYNCKKQRKFCYYKYRKPNRRICLW